MQTTNKPLGRCPRCQGKGVLLIRKNGETISRKCVLCRGSGCSSGGLNTK